MKNLKYKYDSDFLNNGVISFNNKLKKASCEKIIKLIGKKYHFGKHMFKTQEQFEKSSGSIGVNPGVKSNNFALKLNLTFIEKNKDLIKILKKILGNNYKILLKKFVVQVPESWIPSWIKKKIKREINPNLNRYILPEYQQLTYFRGVDYHMDLIEHKMEKVKFITLYIYLNKVSKNNSPLNIIDKSYKFGAQKFPHSLKKLRNNNVLYKNKKFKKRVLVGDSGSCYIWSCLNLHGASENNSTKPRISLRYKIRSNKFGSQKSLIDKLFNNLNGPKFLKIARNDVNEKNAELIKFRGKNKSLIFKK